MEHLQTKGIVNNRFIYFEGFNISFIKKDDIHRFLSQYGDIRDIRLQHDTEGKFMGSGMVEFEKSESAQRLLDLSMKIQFIRRTLKFEKIYNPDCWFCLNSNNPKAVKADEIIYEDEHCYIVLCKGPVNPRHILLIPKLHIHTRKGLSDEIDNHIEKMKRKIAKIFLEKCNEQCFFSEYYLGNITPNAAHLILHVIPFPKQKFPVFEKIFSDKESHIISSLARSKALKHDDNLKSYLEPNDFYFSVEISGDFNEEEEEEFYKIRRLVILSEEKSKTFPRDNGRKIFCEIMGCIGKADWKQCEALNWTADEYRRKLRDLFDSHDDSLARYKCFQ